MIVGLDISTSITGITILSNQGQRLATTFVDTRKGKDFFDKASRLKHGVSSVIHDTLSRQIKDGSDDDSLEKIFVEQSLQAFRPGLSSAKTLLSLAGMNKVVSFALYEEFGMVPEYIGAPTARKLCGIKISKGTKAKVQVLQFLLDNEDGFVVEYTAQGNPKAQYYDMADSIIIARAGFEQWKQSENLKS